VSNKKQHRKQKAREKRKKARTKAAAAAAARRERANPSASLKASSSWPVSDCWVTGNWHEWEAQVTAIFVRQHPDGYVAASIFEVDLAERKLVRCSVARDAGVQQALVELSDGEHHLESCEPEFVVKLVAESLLNDDAKPGGFGKASKMLQGVNPDDSDAEFRWGFEDEEADTDETPKAGPGLFDRVKGWFGR